MATTERMEQPAEVASKVLRRAQVSKMTRALQNRLALANVKIKHGWENLSIDTIEPKIEMELKRKRPGSSNDALSDASSISTDRFYPPGLLDSSPLAAPIFSDDVCRSGGPLKRPRYSQQFKYSGSASHSRSRIRHSSGGITKARSWKTAYSLPESSPVYSKRYTRFPVSHGPALSFISEGSTVADDLASPVLSEEDDEDLPLHSFQLATNSTIRSSPPPRSPRTPPPGLARSARFRQNAFNAAARARTGEEDANLLMYLATSPSPAQNSKSRMVAPSTPPPKATPLPSSMMSTPGGGGPFPGFGLATPGANLNFSDFLNMTPSPAQVGSAWSRTPGVAKTPITAREARRRLNFDTLLPPSPLIGGKSEKGTGLGMDLGGELVS